MYATSDGMPTQTDKAKVLHHLDVCFQPLTPTNEPVANVNDDNIQLFVLSSIPDNLQGAAEKVLDRLAKSFSFYFIYYCLTNGINVHVQRVHGRGICFAKLEQFYHLTSTDEEVVAVRSVDALYFTGKGRCQNHAPL